MKTLFSNQNKFYSYIGKHILISKATFYEKETIGITNVLKHEHKNMCKPILQITQIIFTKINELQENFNNSFLNYYLIHLPTSQKMLLIRVTHKYRQYNKKKT